MMPLRRILGAPSSLEAFDDEEHDREEERRRRARAVKLAESEIPLTYRTDLSDPALLDRVGSFTQAGKRVGGPKAIAESLAAIREPYVLWTGGTATGKSVLAGASAISRVKAEGRGSLMMIRAGLLACASRYSGLGRGMPPELEKAKKVDLLILDEIGERLKSGQWDDVAEVVFYRYENGLPLWATTWLTERGMGVEQGYGGGFARRIFGGREIRCGA